MNTDYPPGAFFKSEQPSRVQKQIARKATAEAHWRTVTKQVDKRDNHRCRACASRCDPDAVDLLGKGHRHHLEYRSKGGQDVASNLLTLCARCHDAEHRKVLMIEATTPHGADGPVEIWRLNGPEATWYMTRRETAVHRVEKD